jgi:glycine/D-amino acid oxidase-like deaminating enzyme
LGRYVTVVGVGISSAKMADALCDAGFDVLVLDSAPGIWPSADCTYAWCGSFGSSATGTPSIGAVPGMARCFAVLGFGGNGITFSAMASQMILGCPDPDRDLFAFTTRR